MNNSEFCNFMHNQSNSAISQVDYTWSVNPAAIAGVRLAYEPSGFLTRRLRPGPCAFNLVPCSRRPMRY